jgi:hypothetical protein
MGVKIGDEMFRPAGALLFRGDLRKENIDEVRDCLSSWARSRFDGLFRSFFRPPVFAGLAFTVLDDGDGSTGG